MGTLYKGLPAIITVILFTVLLSACSGSSGPNPPQKQTKFEINIEHNTSNLSINGSGKLRIAIIRPEFHMLGSDHATNEQHGNISIQDTTTGRQQTITITPKTQSFSFGKALSFNLKAPKKASIHMLNITASFGKITKKISLPITVGQPIQVKMPKVIWENVAPGYTKKLTATFTNISANSIYINMATVSGLGSAPGVTATKPTASCLDSHTLASGKSCTIETTLLVAKDIKKIEHFQPQINLQYGTNADNPKQFEATATPKEPSTVTEAAVNGDTKATTPKEAVPGQPTLISFDFKNNGTKRAYISKTPLDLPITVSPGVTMNAGTGLKDTCTGQILKPNQSCQVQLDLEIAKPSTTPGKSFTPKLTLQYGNTPTDTKSLSATAQTTQIINITNKLLINTRYAVWMCNYATNSGALSNCQKEYAVSSSGGFIHYLTGMAYSPKHNVLYITNIGAHKNRLITCPFGPKTDYTIDQSKCSFNSPPSYHIVHGLSVNGNKLAFANDYEHYNNNGLFLCTIDPSGALSDCQANSISGITMKRAIDVKLTSTHVYIASFGNSKLITCDISSTNKATNCHSTSNSKAIPKDNPNNPPLPHGIDIAGNTALVAVYINQPLKCEVANNTGYISNCQPIGKLFSNRSLVSMAFANNDQSAYAVGRNLLQYYPSVASLNADTKPNTVVIPKKLAIQPGNSIEEILVL